MNINTPDYWDTVWKREGSNTYRQYPELFNAIVSLIPQNSSVIDFGCGVGVLLKYINKIPNVYTTGVDISQVAIDILQNSGIDGTVDSIESFSTDKTYDFAIATELVEHLDNDTNAITKLCDIAKTVFVSVPNNSLPPEVEPEHQRVYTGQSLKKLFPEDNDTEVLEIGPHLLARSSSEILQNKRTKVMVAILNQGQINIGLANTLIHISHDTRYSTKIIYPSFQPISNNRNQIVNLAINGDWDYLIMIDNDIVPHFNPLDLVSLKKDVVGAVCLQWNDGDLYWVAMDKIENAYKPINDTRRNNIQKVDAIGTGCICIKVDMLHKINALFNNKWSDDGTLKLGEDFTFCEFCKEHGFEIWADWTKQCGHVKNIDLFDMWRLLNG